MDIRWTLPALSALLLAACGGDARETEPEAETVAEVATETATPAAPSSDTQADGPRVSAVPDGSMAADPMVLGNPDSPVKIVEYASVTCPGCAMFHAFGWPFVKEMAVETGRIEFEYREFPTPPQNLAYAGFYLARCSATTNGPKAYFRILDTLYARQREWTYGPDAGEVLMGIGAQAGFDREGLEDCFFRPDIKEAVANNVATGTRDNVRQTPTFKLNGDDFSWDGSPLAMLHKIEQELASNDQPALPVGSSATVDLAIDMCDSILKNSERALPGKTSRGEDTEVLKTLRVSTPDGGALMAACEAPQTDVTTHTLTISKVATE